ncbi:unnamed protein product, partial [Durusdinium trenchii]
ATTSPFGSAASTASPFTGTSSATPFGSGSHAANSPFGPSTSTSSSFATSTSGSTTSASPFGPSAGVTSASPFATATTSSPFAAGVSGGSGAVSPFTKSEPKATPTQATQRSQSPFASGGVASASPFTSAGAAASPFARGGATSPFAQGAQTGPGPSSVRTSSQGNKDVKEEATDLLKRVGWQLTSFGDNQATLVSNDMSFEELHWTLLQKPRNEWSSLAAEKLAEAKQKWSSLCSSSQEASKPTSPFGACGASPFANAAGAASASGASVPSPFGSGARSVSPFASAVASPFAKVQSQAASPAGLEPVTLRPHEERPLDDEALKAFQALTFEWQKIPEVD